MKLFNRSILLLVLAVICTKQATAFDTTFHKTVNATILLPLYLDSAFKNDSYRYGSNIPKFILSTLEFYNGVQLAADSLRQEGINARIEVIDSRKDSAATQLFSQANYYKPALIIGIVQSGSELKTLSGLALSNNVPFISATYPNDGGVTANQNLLIVNSTLKTHCTALYKYLQRNYNGENVVLVTRKGGLDDRIKNYLREAEKNAEGNKFKWAMASLPDSFTNIQLAVYLDSNKHNTIIGATLDGSFSSQIISTLSALNENYKSTVFGMPTWDELPLQKPEYKGIDVYYSTPFISYSGNPNVYSSLIKKFKKIANSKPSDMVFKGFEVTYRYIKTLYQHPDEFMKYVNDGSCKVFADFKFEAVVSKQGTDVTNYWENKKIYFVKKTDGTIKGVY
jgi:hypothetical protein